MAARLPYLTPMSIQRKRPAMKNTTNPEAHDTLAEQPPGTPVTRYEDTRNITRLDPRNSKKAAATRGWWVRIQRNGKVTSRLFSDSQYGGIPGALEAAMAWRDEQLARLGHGGSGDSARMRTPAALDKMRQAVTKTGVTGISVVVYDYVQAKVPYVTAYWIDEDGRRRHTSFSAARHGVKGALRLAAKARARTSNWHGAKPMSSQKLYNAAFERVQELAAPYL